MKRFIVLLSTSFFLLFGFAFAHSELESSSPEDGATLTEAPTEIVLTFKKDIEADFSIFKVYPLPADMIADAEMSGTETEHSEEGEHSETEASTEDTSETTTSETTEHAEEGEHAALDAAAKVFVPTVIDLQGDEDVRVDTGVMADSSNSVTLTLKEELAPGAYVAMFRILSADTHTVEGFITFEVEGGE